MVGDKLTSVTALELGCSMMGVIMKMNTSLYSTKPPPLLKTKFSCLPSKDSDPLVHYDNFCVDGQEEDPM